jgi:hypothetical protein
MSEINRRDALKLLATAPVAGALQGGGETRLLPVLDPSTAGGADAVADDAQQGARYVPKFFTAREWQTVRVLVDDIIPRDERSGSATEARVPEYIDFVLADQTPAPRDMAPTQAQLAIRGGLAWLDGECRRRFEKAYARCTPAERHQVLDDIAWPARAKPEMSHGVAFFNRMRDLTAAGFFSSRMGVQDLRYMGNVFVAEWKGCPDAALQKLGVG